MAISTNRTLAKINYRIHTDAIQNHSLFFDDLLDAKLREFNPRYAEVEGALLGQFRHLHTAIYADRGELIK